jgi:glycine/D-amino acid oxidase-like deaminating enzyme
MRLRTFEPFGLIANGLLNSYPSLQNKNESAEIVVVGAGITGALVSFGLVEKNYRVILLDKRDVGFGSTAATTSILQYEIDVPLYKLAEMIGEQDAVLCYEKGIEAIYQLAGIISENRIECDFESKKSLYIAREKKDREWLRKEFEIRSKYKLGVAWLEGEEVFRVYGIRCYGAILSEVAASADAYRLAHALIAISVCRGMKVYDHTAIDEIDQSNEKVTVVASGGNNITCDKVIFCTGYETRDLLKEKTADLFFTYASVSELGIKIPDQLKKTLVWDTGYPYMYMKTTGDGRLLIGGEDSADNSTPFQNRIKEQKAKKLIKRLSKIMPGVEFVEDFSWGGTFGSSKDGLPYIGKSPEYERALFVLGFGGNGIVFSVQAIGMILDMLEGKENPLINLYRFGR